MAASLLVSRVGAGSCEKQIPGGNDRKKGKGKNGRQQVPRCARKDNFFQKLSKKGNGNAKSNGNGSGNGEGEGEGKLGGGFEVEGG